MYGTFSFLAVEVVTFNFDPKSIPVVPCSKGHPSVCRFLFIVDSGADVGQTDKDGVVSNAVVRHSLRVISYSDDDC